MNNWRGNIPKPFKPRIILPLNLFHFHTSPHIKFPHQPRQSQPHLHVRKIDSETASGTEREGFGGAVVVVLEFIVVKGVSAGKPALGDECAGTSPVIFPPGCGP